MYIDFHCHSKLTKKVAFDIKYFNQTVKVAKKNGLTALVLTEHFSTYQFDRIYETLDANYPYKAYYYDIDGFRVLTGMEVNIQEGGHIVVFGHKQDVLALRHQFPEKIGKKDFPTFSQLMQGVKSHGLISIGAHPCRKSASLVQLGTKLEQLDFLEMNGKDIGLKDKMLDLAIQLNMPIVAGSDTHHYIQVGTVRNHLYHECGSLEELKACLKDKQFDILISPKVHLKNKTAKIIKKVMKRVKHI